MESHFNRAKQLWCNWEAKQKDLEAVSGLGNDLKAMAQQKYKFLREGLNRLSLNTSTEEKIYMSMITAVTDKLQRALYPNAVVRAVHQFKNELYDRPKYLKNFRKFKADNLGEIGNYLQSHGFGNFYGKLEQYLDFELPANDIDIRGQLDKDTAVEFYVSVDKNEKGAYAVEGVLAGLKYADPDKNRSFAFSRDYDVTANKAVNLLLGRSVRNGSDGSDPQWLQLDFSKADPGGFPAMQIFQPGYGYDLKTELGILAAETGLSRLTAPDVQRELEQGGQVRFKGHHPLDPPLLLEANPAGRSLMIRDLAQHPVHRDQLLEQMQQVRQQRETVFPDIRQKQDKEKEKEYSMRIG